jgi:hypothetical protein
MFGQILREMRAFNGGNYRVRRVDVITGIIAAIIDTVYDASLSAPGTRFHCSWYCTGDTVEQVLYVSDILYFEI